MYGGKKFKFPFYISIFEYEFAVYAGIYCAYYL